MSAIFGVTKDNWGAKYLGLDFLAPVSEGSLIITPFLRDTRNNHYSQNQYNRLTQYFFDGDTKEPIGHFSIDGNNYGRAQYEFGCEPSKTNKRDLSVVDTEKELALLFSQQSLEENTSSSAVLAMISFVHSQLLAKGIRLESMTIRHTEHTYGAMGNVSILEMAYNDSNISISLGVRLGKTKSNERLVSLSKELPGYYILPEASLYASYMHGRFSVAREIDGELRTILNLSTYQLHADHDGPIPTTSNEVVVSDADLVNYLEGVRQDTPEEVAKLIRLILTHVNAGKITSIERTLDVNNSSLNIRARQDMLEYQIAVDI